MAAESTVESTIVINEIMYDFPGSDDKHEWIEIYNSTSNAIDLTNWKFYEAETNHGLSLVQGNIIISSQAYAVIADDANTFLTDHTDYAGALFDSAFSLSNSGESLALKDSSLNIVDQITYDVSLGANGNGKTLERGSPGALAPGWQESFIDKGTPGAENSKETPPSQEPPPAYSPGQIVINEFVPDPSDGQEEWVELFNKTNSLVNLTGWTIEEGSESLTNLSGEIAANGFLVIENPKGYLNNAGDIIILKDPLEQIIDQNTYGDWNDGNLNDNAPKISDPNSLARTKDGNDTNNDFNDFKVTTSLTKGSSNVISNPGAPTDVGGLPAGSGAVSPADPGARAPGLPGGTGIIINEILPNPKGSDEKKEFIELKNLGKENVDLTGWKLGDESSRIYTISSKDFTSVIISAGGFFVLAREKTKIALNNTGGDSVKLYWPNGELVDSIKYTESAKEDQSYTRCPTRGPGGLPAGLPVTVPALSEGVLAEGVVDCGANQWLWTTTPTPNKENIITRPNNPPEAVISVKEKAKINEKLFFDASDSSDPDGDALTYLWDFGDGGKGEGVSPSHSYQKPGSYEVFLVVKDNPLAPNSPLSRGVGGCKGEDNPLTPNSPLSRGVGGCKGEDGLKGEAKKIIFIFQTENSVFLNELLPNPQGPDLEEEWIEIFNQSSGPVNLTGWKLKDDKEDYEIPEKTTIQPKGYLVFKREKTKIVLNNIFDSVYLIDPSEKIISQIDYEKPPEAVSYARDKDGLWKWTFKLTPGKENILLGSPAALAAGASPDSPPTSVGAPGSAAGFIEITLDKIDQFDLGDKIKVKGTVTVEPGILGSQIFYITGSNGIQVYLNKKDFPELKFGDYLELEGILSETSGEKRIKLASKESIKILGHQNLPKPSEIKTGSLEEDQIGSLITLEGEVTEKKGNYFWLDDGFEEIKVYLKDSTGIERPIFKLGDRIKVTGILSFLKEDFRLLPRYQSDLELIQKAEAKTLEDSTSQVMKLFGGTEEKGVIKYLLLTIGALVVILIGVGTRYIVFKK